MKENNSSDDFDGIGVKPFNFPNDSFHWAGVRHDAEYIFKGPTRSNEMRRAVDEQFLIDMKNIIKQKNKWWLYPKAYFYYTMARTFGARFFD